MQDLFFAFTLFCSSKFVQNLLWSSLNKMVEFGPFYFFKQVFFWMEVILDTFFYIMYLKPKGVFDNWKLWELLGCVGNAVIQLSSCLHWWSTQQRRWDADRLFITQPHVEEVISGGRSGTVGLTSGKSTDQFCS